MNKLLCVVSSPVDTFSGYGNRSRDFIRSLIKVKGDEWDIKLLSQRWGSTPFGALDPSKKEDKDLLDRIIPGMTVQPDVWVQITVSNEFQPVGKYNIGVSALVETDVLPAEMLNGLNQMNLNLVSSNHSKMIAVNSSFQQMDKNTGQKMGELKLQKPVEVLFEGIDTEVFKKIDWV